MWRGGVAKAAYTERGVGEIVVSTGGQCRAILAAAVAEAVAAAAAEEEHVAMLLGRCDPLILHTLMTAMPHLHPFREADVTGGRWIGC